ncbi:L,D-transpeptidase family protein [Flavobacterium xueshanense]|uniref:Murein L,D-transpeptidase YcbB/YkuD n=1 Tax=Flavobacterium xueshanense TaxID=935223 RepID=A0A1I2AMK4_9FLAO|nr:L,D-transpeptidase family protein [Flavobacterium xueshanense]SFE44947.1 Murein L,D-transpeptidase YcbB/YkuD [Flavobacterium xueshanense]
MKKLFSPILIVIFTILFTAVSCKKKSNTDLPINQTSTNTIEVAFDSTQIKTFFEKYPKLKNYQGDVEKLYRKHQFHYIWFDKDGLNEFAGLLYNKVNNLTVEGIETVIPYKKKLDDIYDNPEENQKASIDTELLSSSLYFFYADKVYDGISTQKTKDLGWFLPRKRQSYVNYLDSLLINPSLINKDEKGVLKQYYLLKDVLQEYRKIEKKGGWKTIALDPNVKSYKPGDSAATISQIRTRLLITGDLSRDSKSAVYDDELATGILKFKKRSGNTINKTILPEHINYMNVPVAARIKTLMVNMERCRWISNDITKSKELIVVNIPAYELTFFRNGIPELRSKVVVGKTMHKTVIFSAPMKYIVFRPYWNVPASILKKEILPAIEKNPNYLAEHDMEWKDDYVRQKPGPENSLGLVKFLFPNSNAIYLHDTPSKSLFGKEDRAFSHGCIRVAKPKELAAMIMKNDKKWNPEKIETAMNGGEEYWYTLKNKIPVYIGYFTAWIDDDGVVHFYEDIYNKDEALATLLFDK